MSWQDEAACKGRTRTMYPVEAEGPTVDRARAVCADCPVRIDCLVHALNNGEDHGVWGGFTEAQRRTIRRRGRL